MKTIILAAGQGIRLKPLTDNQPKCMVKFKNKAIIDYILEANKGLGINDISVVCGYKKEVIENHLKNNNVKLYFNPKYDSTNMVSTLFCAENEMSDDLIISYADIIYEKKVLEKLMNDDSDFAVVVDRKWKELWDMRMENPLEDAETMKIDKDGFIYELGKKPQSYDEIQGQYIGLIKFSKSFLPKVINHYKNLDKNLVYDNKNFDNMYMTSFIQSLIDNVQKAKAVYIDRGWIEIDSLKDLEIYSGRI